MDTNSDRPIPTTHWDQFEPVSAEDYRMRYLDGLFEVISEVGPQYRS